MTLILKTNEQINLKNKMSEVVFAMIAAIVGSVMIFLIILALFYAFALLTIKVFRKLKREWENPDT